MYLNLDIKSHRNELNEKSKEATKGDKHGLTINHGLHKLWHFSNCKGYFKGIPFLAHLRKDYTIGDW